MSKELSEEFEKKTGVVAEFFNGNATKEYKEWLEKKYEELRGKYNLHLLNQVAKPSQHLYDQVNELETEVRRLKEQSNNRGEQIRNIKRGLENEGLNWFAESINAPKAEQ